MRVPELIESKRSVDTQDHDWGSDEHVERLGGVVQRVVGSEDQVHDQPHDKCEQGESQVQQGPSSVVHAQVGINTISRHPEYCRCKAGGDDLDLE